ncbi:MAG: hypothetical protein JWM21_465 [Acidobacteria bacterium]|nr:hypothetical protein [Acidobacteriota bacterium]
MTPKKRVCYRSLSRLIKRRRKHWSDPFGKLNSRTMITGYNTDVEHDGVVYHVQTEDKGLDTPLVLSLVYSGGAILASKRSSYRDLITAGFDEAVLTERLQRQHRLICAAINAGRIDDLKKMGAPPRHPPQPPLPLPPSIASPVPIQADEPQLPPVETAPDEMSEPGTAEAGAELLVTGNLTPRPRPTAAPKGPSAYTVYDARRRAPGKIPQIEEGLRIVVVGEKDFRGGDEMELEITVIRVSNQGEVPVAATVSVKILGTSFRPVILSLKTNKQGTVSVSARIPQFRTGRAAIVIRATAAELSNETRRVIHPG